MASMCNCKAVKSSYHKHHLQVQDKQESFDGQMSKYIHASRSNLDPYANALLAQQAGHPIYYTHYPGWSLPYSHNMRHPMFRSGVMYPTSFVSTNGYKQVGSAYDPFNPEH